MTMMGGSSCSRCCRQSRNLVVRRQDVTRRLSTMHGGMPGSMAVVKPPKLAVMLPPRVVSRRAWETHVKENAPLFRRPPPTGPKVEEKPWPRNVVITAYVAAGVFIPYTALWTCVNNDTLRPYALKAVGPTLEPIVRRHFGTPEWHAIAYPDQITLDKKIQEVPHVLMGEPDYYVRNTQARIIKEQNAGDIVVRVQVVAGESSGNSGSSGVVMEELKRLSRTLWARPEQLLSKQELSPVSSVAIDFPEDDAVDPVPDTATTKLKDTSNQLMTDSESANSSIGNESVNESNSRNDDWRKQIAIYSSWHYQPMAPVSNTAGGGTQFSNHEMRVAELKALIVQLEREMRAGTRDMDAIESDINRAKNQLRKLTWGKWLPW